MRNPFYPDKVPTRRVFRSFPWPREPMRWSIGEKSEFHPIEYLIRYPRKYSETATCQSFRIFWSSE